MKECQSSGSGSSDEDAATSNELALAVPSLLDCAEIITVERDGSNASNHGNGTNVAQGNNNQLALAMPNLADQSRHISDAGDPEKESEVAAELTAIHERLASAERERDGLRSEMDKSRRERDSLRRMVNALKPLGDSGDSKSRTAS